MTNVICTHPFDHLSGFFFCFVCVTGSASFAFTRVISDDVFPEGMYCTHTHTPFRSGDLLLEGFREGEKNSRQDNVPFLPYGQNVEFTCSSSNTEAVVYIECGTVLSVH